jgi:hypothetical protein
MEQPEFKTDPRILEKNSRWRKNNPEKKREADRKHYQRTREKQLEYKKNYYAKNREEKLQRASINSAKRRAKQRQAIFDLLGRKCVRCGFDDVRALQVDHINGGGTKERTSLASPHSVYKKVLACGGEGYQILCANCNQIKRYEQNESVRHWKMAEQ